MVWGFSLKRQKPRRHQNPGQCQPTPTPRALEYANKLEEQLQAEVVELLKRAEMENRKGSKNLDIDIPVEIQRREERLAKIADIKIEIEKRAQARYELEKAEYDAFITERTAFDTARGRKLGGRLPKEPEPGPRPKDQINFTDEDSRIMPKSGGSFIQGYNAQATVDSETMLIAGKPVSQKTSVQQEVEPLLTSVR